MPRIAAPLKQEDTPHSIHVANRLKIFRELFIDKNQTRAAEMLGLSQARLSQIESGKRPVNWHLLDKLTKDFNLNTRYLSDNQEPKQLKKPVNKDKTTGQMDMLLEEMNILKSYLATLEKTFNSALKIMERQEQKLKELESKIDKK
jgi:transcriptional regulator with XRE-family HTH domain